MLSGIVNFLKDRRGMELVQVIIIAMLLGIATIGVCKGLRNQISDVVVTIAKQLHGDENAETSDRGAKQIEAQATKAYTMGKPNNNID